MDIHDSDMQAKLDNLENMKPVEEPRPPMVDVARPDIAPPVKRKRGRQPMPRDAQGNIIRDPTQVAAAKLSAELGKRLPGKEALTNENVGKAVAGSFAVIGLFRGPHWRLFPMEEAQLGECFGPYARMYGSDELAKWIVALTIIPVVTTIVMPRLGVEKLIMAGDIAKQDGRVALLGIKSMIAAEKELDIDKAVKEAQAEQKALHAAKSFIQQKVAQGVSAAGDMAQAQTESEGVVQ